MLLTACACPRLSAITWATVPPRPSTHRSFSLSRPAVLCAALAIAPTEEFALRIADLLVELVAPRTIDRYDYARYATEWAMQTCKADLFKRAEARLARRDGALHDDVARPLQRRDFIGPFGL